MYPNGRVTWTPSATLEAYCELDLRRWPFEQHACTLDMGSWTLDRTQLIFDQINTKLEVGTHNSVSTESSRTQH